MHLPSPYPDEIVGSMLYRAEQILGICHERLLLLMTERNLSHHSFLSTQYTGVSKSYGMDFNSFLKNHTVIPYVTAFMTKSDSRKYYMNDTNGESHVVVTSSLLQHATLDNKWLKFCPLCVQHDLNTYGESYWHRIHQLRGVDYCTLHDIDLLHSTYRINRGKNITPPHDVVFIQPSSSFKLAKNTRASIAKLSAEVLWGLHDCSNSVERYRTHAKKLGYIYGKNRIHGALISRDLEHYFGEGYFDSHNCSIQKNFKSPWPVKLLQESGHNVTAFKHIILKTFLETQPKPSISRVNFEKRNQPKYRDWKKVEDDAIEFLNTEIKIYKQTGARVNVGDLHRRAGVISIVKTKAHMVPRLMNWLAEFRKSPESSRIPNRRPRK